jgi:hypothetical protein
MRRGVVGVEFAGVEDYNWEWNSMRGCWVCI